MTEQNQAYDRLIKILEDLFQLNQADLDFGIYRIMNQKREEITDFLENRLVAQVKTTLGEQGQAEKEKLERQLREKEEELRQDGFNPDESETVKNLRLQLLQADTTELQNTTFSHLTNFFKRYYKDGDFISQRRYKDDVFAIPYQGEEVKLHWANHDQYYIKTSEYFKNYRFKLRNGKWVNFELREASTEQNNNKAQNGERKFKLAEENIYQEEGDTLTIYFTYEPMSKKKKQNKLMDDAFKELKEELPSAWLTELLQPKPTKKDKNRTVLQKHLKDYTARNTFDYFIHKDLGKFLHRELDFYVKNEILHIDDIDLDKEESYRQALQVIKAFNKVGLKIIEFLAQLEDFQKKLWLKKKFVLQSDYCITLDRIDEEFYAEIATNDRQREEWVNLYAIDKLVGYSEPLTADFLKENPFLMVDTQFFDREWKYKILATIDHLDEQISGLMINSENSQAIRLLNHKYDNCIDVIYIDPPYNTSENTFVYKNQYKHSSWITMMGERIQDSHSLLSERGVLETAIDDTEYPKLKLLIDQIFKGENYLATFPVQVNPAGQNIRPNAPALSHDYFVVHAKHIEKSVLNPRPLTPEEKESYPEKDEKSRYYWDNLRRRGGNSRPTDRPNQWFPLYIDPDKDKISTKPFDGADEVWPIDSKGIKRIWRYNKEGVEEQIALNEVGIIRKADEWRISKKSRMPEGKMPKTLWYKSKYSGTSHGTKLLQNILGGSIFSYPKSFHLTKDAVYLWTQENSIVFDFFAGSATTADAVIKLNQEDGYNRKYILAEMGQYFNSVTKPRIQKVVYSKKWKDGKPVDREGISHMFKYLRLESYEDTLNNLPLKRTQEQEDLLSKHEETREEYVLKYMLDIEARDSLLNTEMFKRPFGYKIQSTEHNERVETEVDLVETFNYLIGLTVESLQMIRGYVVVTGHNNDGEQILVIWRDTEKQSNRDLEEFVDKMEFNPHDSEFDLIYVNGDNNLQNIRKDEETWKVRLIEEEFHKRMFETKGL